MKTDELFDLRMVGSKKPLGYLPISAIRQYGHDELVVANELGCKGLETLLLNNEESNVGIYGALYAWDEFALQSHLDKNRDALIASGWPTECLAFVCNLKIMAAPNSFLYVVIGQAFADKRFKATSS